jgi:hypothetical protein
MQDSLAVKVKRIIREFHCDINVLQFDYVSFFEQNADIVIGKHIQKRKLI